MNCPLQNDNAELLLDYVSRKLSPDLRETFETHMLACEECRTFAEGQKAVWNALESWEGTPIAEDFDDRLYARIAEHEERSWWRRMWVRMAEPAGEFAWGKTAVAVAAMSVALLIYSPSHAPAPVDAPVKAEAVDLDQVERALEDLEMLKQLSPKDSKEL